MLHLSNGFSVVVRLFCKDRNDMNLPEVEDVKKRWQECIEVLYKKDLNAPDNHDGVITNL